MRRAVEQHHAEPLLQRADAAAEGRLRHVAFFGRAREVAASSARAQEVSQPGQSSSSSGSVRCFGGMEEGSSSIGQSQARRRTFHHRASRPQRAAADCQTRRHPCPRSRTTAASSPRSPAPSRRDHRIDEPALRKLASWLAAQPGVVAVMTNGHTGEVFSLQPHERAEVTRIVADELKGKPAGHLVDRLRRHRATPRSTRDGARGRRDGRWT